MSNRPDLSKPEHLDLLLHHVLDQDLAAAERDALRPAADRRLAEPPKPLAVHLEDDEPAVLVVKGEFGGLVAAVVDHYGDEEAVGRTPDAFRRLADGERFDHPRRVQGEVDDADRVGVALVDADVRDHGDVAGRADIDAVGPQAGVDVALRVGDVRAVDGEHEILSSPSRVTSAVLPPGVIAMPLGLDCGAPKSTLPAGATVFPVIVNTDTVPALRSATSARLPARLMAMPAAPIPASRKPTTFGGGVVKSITDTRSSGTPWTGRRREL